MPINDIPILTMLRERMQWQQARQQVLAENVANADTPDYQAKDLVPLDFSQQLAAASLPLERTSRGAHRRGVRRRRAIRRRAAAGPTKSGRAATR